MSKKLQNFRDLRSLIPKIVRPTIRKTIIDEKILQVLQKTNICCKGCVRRDIAAKVKEIDEGQ